MPLNFSEIRKNAEEQSISLTEIAIVYANLTEQQIRTLDERGLLVSNTGNGRCIGRFAENGDALFPEMATGVLTLSA